MPLSPDTGEELAPLVVDGMTLYVCSHTGGIWFPEDALNKMRQQDAPALQNLDRQTAPSQPVQVDASKPHRCPLDGSLLIHYHFQPVYDAVLEQCMQCGGMWVPHTELDKIAAEHPAAPPVEPPPRHVTYPINEFGQYDDSVQPTPEPPNLAPEARAAVQLMESQTNAAINRARAFQVFSQVVNWDPFRTYIGRRTPFEV